MIYLDHAAATPMSQKVREAMEPYFSERFFNPSAAYLPAKWVAEAYERAKGEIAHAVGAKAVDLVMTGSATEANNLAFNCLSADGEILTLATEHDSVRQVARRRWEKLNGSVACNRGRRGGAKNEIGRQKEVRWQQEIRRQKETEQQNTVPANSESPSYEIAVDKNGRIELADLRQKITERTELVSVALVNNELGTIQPLTEVAAILKEVRQERLAKGSKRPLYLHSDASQALNLLDVNVARLGVDLLTLNAAKVYGPKGVGALYVARGVRLEPLTVGGGQENGLRSGTENVAGVVGFAAAARAAKEHMLTNRKKYRELKRVLLENLQGYTLINRKHSLDNFVVLCYNGLDAERLLYLLEEQEIYVATGAACAASKGEKSHVLAAIGLPESEIAGSLRLTLGELNDVEQMKAAAESINAVVAKEMKRTGAAAGKAESASVMAADRVKCNNVVVDKTERATKSDEAECKNE